MTFKMIYYPGHAHSSYGKHFYTHLAQRLSQQRGYVYDICFRHIKDTIGIEW